MILTIDIGNSYITIGGYEEETLCFVTRLVTEHRFTPDQYAVQIQALMKLYHIVPHSVEGAIISSVVPELVTAVRGAVEILCGVRALVVGPGIKSGLHITIDNPAQLGADIVACAVAALEKGKLPCIIYDLGTASTVSVLDREGKFLGVVICAGVGTTLETLTAKTALLPHVSIEAPRAVIGKNTMQSMQSGLVYGTAAMLDGIADRIEREIGAKAHIIATGANAEQIVRYCDKPVEVCEHLLLEGLKMIYYKNRKI